MCLNRNYYTLRASTLMENGSDMTMIPTKGEIYCGIAKNILSYTPFLL